LKFDEFVQFFRRRLPLHGLLQTQGCETPHLGELYTC
jgi:hypothetical protein